MLHVTCVSLVSSAKPLTERFYGPRHGAGGNWPAQDLVFENQIVVAYFHSAAAPTTLSQRLCPFGVSLSVTVTEAEEKQPTPPTPAPAYLALSETLYGVTWMGGFVSATLMNRASPQGPEDVDTPITQRWIRSALFAGGLRDEDENVRRFARMM